jgi:hypothetical protein
MGHGPHYACAVEMYRGITGSELIVWKRP